MANENYDKVLIVTNGLQSSASTHETGLNLAKKHRAKVLLVDTVQPPGTFAKWLAPNSKDVFEMVLADKQKRLDEIARTFENAGIETETKVLLGRSSEAITAEAILTEADIVVRYAKGPNSKFMGHVGNTARALLRYCPIPVLLVGNQAIENPRILACLDAQHDIKENNAIVSESSRLAANTDDLLGIYCWEMYAAEMMKKRMHPDAFTDSVERTHNLYKDTFNRMMDNLNTDVLNLDNVELVKGEPHLIIPGYCSRKNIDVLTMCTATLHHPVRRFFGSTVEAILEKLPCAILAVKPDGFVSPITPEEASQMQISQ